MLNHACCSSQMELLALTRLNKLSIIKINILPNLHCLLQVHFLIYYAKLFNLIKNRKVQSGSNNSFPSIKWVGFSPSESKAIYHGPIPVRDLFAFTVPGSSEAVLTIIILCGSQTSLGHWQPFHPRAELGLPLRLNSIAGTAVKTRMKHRFGNTPLFHELFFLLLKCRWNTLKGEVLSGAATKGLSCAEGGQASGQLMCNGITKCCWSLTANRDEKILQKRYKAKWEVWPVPCSSKRRKISNTFVKRHSPGQLNAQGLWCARTMQDSNGARNWCKNRDIFLLSTQLSFKKCRVYSSPLSHTKFFSKEEFDLGSFYYNSLQKSFSWSIWKLSPCELKILRIWNHHAMSIFQQCSCSTYIWTACYL